MLYETVVAIDGPSGSGKSSIARDLASDMGLLYVDTGSMFRALAVVVLERGLSPTEENIDKPFLDSLRLEYGISPEELIKINGKNLTESIREHHISSMASKISGFTTVREFLANFQRNLVRQKICVMEGRDIGTVVFPKAFCKIYLTASDKIRAERRLKQLREKGQGSYKFEDILRDVRERDENDSKRALAPLKQAEDAKKLDTTNLGYQEVLDALKAIVLKSAKEKDVEL
ncbi:MAG: cytidylate kinase [Halobacteriovoraceae bacterium]|nr:cytidylate kinase [Halobacteriovoraceae bacterium]|tara:strand:- start:706 stop:1398 length:693 start_codon:yes stop_codon:yes gene_type:complete